MLMFVSVNAVAQEPTTQTVTISKKYGATTFVCDKNLDFTKWCTNSTEGDFLANPRMKPYYISNYNTVDGSFDLTPFSSYFVPANTPMILLGQVNPSASGNYECEVPIVNSPSTASVNSARKAAFGSAHGYCWLVPAINAKYTYDEYVPWDDEANNMVSQKFTFFDYTSASFPIVVPQTENDIIFSYSSTEKLDTAFNYYSKIQLPSSFPNKATTLGQPLGQELYYPDNIDIWDDNLVGKYVILWAYNNDLRPNKDRAIYGLYKCMIDDIWGDYLYVGVQSLSTAAGNCKVVSDAYEWYDQQNLAITKSLLWNVPIERDVTNYVLSVNGTTPVFKKCNSSSGTSVPAGKCYVRVWNDVLVGAASAREYIGLNIDDEDISMVDDETTGIKNLKDNSQAKKVVYNMNGQKLDKMQKGLNIVNGKKLFVK